MQVDEQNKLLPTHIEQVDNKIFSISWSDGKTFMYSLKHLQYHCPCASCRDEASGKRRKEALEVLEDVGAIFLKGVGLYGLKISFTKGCSQGIYAFPYLYRLGEMESWKDNLCED